MRDVNVALILIISYRRKRLTLICFADIKYFCNMKNITSINNSLVRKIEQLQRKSRARKSEGMFVIEGKRELQLADSGDYMLEVVFICPELFSETENSTVNDAITSLELKQSPEVVMISLEVYNKVAYRGSTEGCLAFAKAKTHQLASLQLKKIPLILIAEAPEKPGNLGALLRTADAAAVDAVIIANPKTDLYNPNVIRSSVGCIFTVQVATASTPDVIAYLEKREINLFAATLQNSNRYDSQNFKIASAIAVGTESTGLSPEMRNAAITNIIIPMNGAIDSMNVSVSAAILLFEAKRQRNFQ